MMRHRIAFIGAVLLTAYSAPTPASAFVTYVYGDATGAYFSYTADTYVPPYASVTAQYCNMLSCEQLFLPKRTVDIIYTGNDPTNNYSVNFAKGSFQADGVYFSSSRQASLVVFSHDEDLIPSGVTYVYGDSNGKFFSYTAETYIHPIEYVDAQFCNMLSCEEHFLPKRLNDIIYTGDDPTQNNGVVFTKGSFERDGVNFSLYSTASLVVFSHLAAPSAVPEPWTWAMMMTGLGMVGVVLRRQRIGIASI